MAFDFAQSTASASVILDFPPTLVSDNGSEGFEESFRAIMNNTDDVSSVMGKVLGHLTRISEHLREKEEYEAANEVAKQTINIVNTFNDATASWDMQKCLMSPSPLGQSTVMTQAAAGQGNKVFTGGSWAAVAATATAENNKIVKYRPSDALKLNAEDPAAEASESLDMRVAWVQPWNEKKSLSELTDRLSHGALLSMAYSENDQAVCIIFQHAYQTQAFLEEDAEFTQIHGHGVFGQESHVLPGQAFPVNEDLKRMAPPLNERRRLTFARQALFTNGLTEEQFRKDIYKIVGQSNVELVWLFNTGNATVVFSATAIARLVRDEFRNRARHSGPYKGVQVTFSHDPCERPLNLITQLPQGSRPNAANAGKNAQNVGGYGANAPARGSSSTGSLTCRNSSVTRNIAMDIDGWQTVTKRR